MNALDQDSAGANRNGSRAKNVKRGRGRPKAISLSQPQPRSRKEKVESAPPKKKRDIKGRNKRVKKIFQILKVSRTDADIYVPLSQPMPVRESQ